MYPLSSKKARAKNNMNILGRKVRIPPTPAIIPSTIREVQNSPALIAVKKLTAPSENVSNPPSNTPFIISPIVNVKKKIRAITPKNIGSPK